MIPHSRPLITKADMAAVASTLQTGMISQGERVEQFESRIAEYLGVPGGVAVSSGSAALVLLLRALELPAGGEVILPTYVCNSVAWAVVSAGLKPVFCDVGAEWTVVLDSVERALTPRTVAVIVVHTFGITADVHAIASLGVPVIEDACQALGAMVQGEHAGSVGCSGFLSFHATKCLATGEGGMVVSRDPAVLSRAKALRDGIKREFRRSFAPMTDMQAALGQSQLSRYGEFLRRRAEIADTYRNALHSCNARVDLGTRSAGSIFFRFPVKSAKDFDDSRTFFATRGIHVRRGVDALLHRMFDENDERFAGASKLFSETVSIPLYPALSVEEVERIALCATDYWGAT